MACANTIFQRERVCVRESISWSYEAPIYYTVRMEAASGTSARGASLCRRPQVMVFSVHGSSIAVGRCAQQLAREAVLVVILFPSSVIYSSTGGYFSICRPRDSKKGGVSVFSDC